MCIDANPSQTLAAAVGDFVRTAKRTLGHKLHMQHFSSLAVEARS
jgi:hypothetical protein